MQILSEDFARQITEEDHFEQLQEMQGKVYRDVKGRKTLQFSLGGKSYFVKNHFGVGWLEILKNLVQLRSPILGAENEWHAIAKLKALGIDTMTAVAYDSRGWNPATRESFIVTEDLSNTVSLEDYCRPWKDKPPMFQIKLKLLAEIADIARTLHSNGVCHRDFYLCHFLLPENSLNADSESKAQLFLIDLHRALIKKRLARRWVVKDISGLLYSAMNMGLNQRDFFRFIKRYDDCSLRESLERNRSFWDAVKQRATSMYEKLGPVE